MRRCANCNKPIADGPFWGHCGDACLQVTQNERASKKIESSRIDRLTEIGCNSSPEAVEELMGTVPSKPKPIYNAVYEYNINRAFFSRHLEILPINPSQ